MLKEYSLAEIISVTQSTLVNISNLSGEMQGCTLYLFEREEDGITVYGKIIATGNIIVSAWYMTSNDYYSTGYTVDSIWNRNPQFTQHKNLEFVLDYITKV